MFLVAFLLNIHGQLSIRYFVIRYVSADSSIRLAFKMSLSPCLQDAGIWYLFHRVATGDSHSLAFETKSELTPLGIFYNNRVHSNFKVLYYLILKKFFL